MTIRGDILRRAIGITEGERESTYGDPAITLACMAELKATYRKFSQGKYCPEHEEAMEAALMKIARIATGSFHRDNYVDGAGYHGIAAECQQRANQPESGTNWRKLRED